DIGHGSCSVKPALEIATFLCVREISDTTVHYDGNRKMPLYAKSGVPELWIWVSIRLTFSRRVDNGAKIRHLYDAHGQETIDERWSVGSGARTARDHRGDQCGGG